MNKIEIALYAAALHMLDGARYNIFPNPEDAGIIAAERNRAVARLREILMAEQEQANLPPDGTGGGGSGGRPWQRW